MFESLLLDKNSRKAPLRASNRLLLELTENPHRPDVGIGGEEVESGLLVDEGDYCIGRPAEHTPTPAEQKSMQKKKNNKSSHKKNHGSL